MNENVQNNQPKYQPQINNGGTKICKHCQSEIPKKAKICPVCKKKQGGILKWIVVVFVVLAIIGAIFGEKDGSEPKQNESESVATTVSETNESREVQKKESVPASATEDQLASESVETTEEPQVVESKEEFIASCEEISYKSLLRNPDDYIGKRLKITAQIQQVLQGGWFDDNEYYRVQTDNDGYEIYFDDEYFMYDFRADDTTKLLVDDVLVIYAEFAGTETITRALTSTKEEIPAIKAYYVEIIAE